MTIKHKKYTLAKALGVIFILGSVLSCKDNSVELPKTIEEESNLLVNLETGSPMTDGTINRMTLISSEGEVALVVANDKLGKLFAIKLDDDKPSDATNNDVNSTVTGFASEIASSLGLSLNQLGIHDMRINPISKSIYVLAGRGQGEDRSLLVITNHGTQIELFDFENIEYAELPYVTPGDKIQDLAWGESSIFASFRKPSTLDGEIAEIKAPFSHGSVFTSRATTVYKTNWGGNYFTNAPLERLAYITVNEVPRLAGVTVCAPGFSFPVSDIHDGNGLLEVKEYFNLNTTFPWKVFGAENNGKTYLIEHHDNGRLTRIGEKYLDGSLAEFNANAKYLLMNGGRDRVPGLTDEDVKLLAPIGTYLSVAQYSDTRAYGVALASGDLIHDVSLF
ncbi:MAG: hypothetical protein JJ975_13545 [Bacteroidia bacterium]|nr:hypothetical protein [Bacteroidia bacterium]